MPRPSLSKFFVLSAGLVLFATASPAQAPDELEAVVTTDSGVFRIAFPASGAPKHIQQFIARVREGYYNGSAFHRALLGGMIQGGDPLLKNPKTPRTLWGSGGLSLQPDEPSALKHERGVVSTVSIPGKADSDGAQFFVCVAPQPALDGHYASFGQVTEGMDVVERLSAMPVDKGGIAEKPARILTIALEPKKREPFRNAPLSELKRTVTLKTSLGAVKIQMEPDWAPENVRSFLKLTSTGWYDGTVFHRVIKGFVAQGGTAAGRSVGEIHTADRWIHPIKGEFRNDVKHREGIISMAHGDDPNSATTSFFLVLGGAPNLDGQYSAFGRVVEGLEVLRMLGNQEVEGETPKTRLELITAVIDP